MTVKNHKHVLATKTLKDRCKKCGVWKTKKYVCTFIGCSYKETQKTMCDCSLRAFGAK